MATAGATPDRGDAIITERIEKARRALWRTELASALLVLAIAIIAFDAWLGDPRSLVSERWSNCSIVCLVHGGRGSGGVDYDTHRFLCCEIRFIPNTLPRGLSDVFRSFRHSLLSYLTPAR